jgi:hypothetical protein
MAKPALRVISNDQGSSYEQSALPGTDLPEMAALQGELILRVIGQRR